MTQAPMDGVGGRDAHAGMMDANTAGTQDILLHDKMIAVYAQSLGFQGKI